MPTLNFVTEAGDTFTVDASVGSTVMDVAVQNSVPGIEAECGGACACATCHVYVQDMAKLPTADSIESDMIEFAWEANETSRLSCQLKVTEEMDGMVFKVPEQQS